MTTTEPRFKVGEVWGNERLSTVDLVGEALSDVAIPPTLLQHEGFQVVAFYDTERILTIADRTIDGLVWNFQKFNSITGWDSHNYTDLGFDRDGRLHVAGNMHASPLQYWIVDLSSRTRRIEQFQVLTDRDRESKVTYPRFLRTPSGKLLFTYRDGISGDGDFVAVLWDEAARQHELLTGGPLIHGGGLRNAYLDSNAPILGPDGDWHLLWVWRDSPEAESTHSINYARSADLANWTCAEGRPLERPITENNLSVVDPVPAGNGLINNNVRLGFMPNGRPVAIYHRRDVAGSQQLWAATFDGSQWAKRQLTNWRFRWDFHGQGSLDFRIEIGIPRTSQGGLSIDVRQNEEVATYLLDENLEVVTMGAASPWNALRRGKRRDHLLDRCTAGRGWAPGDPGPEWFVAYASVPEQRDQRPEASVPASQPLSVIGTSFI